MMRRRKLFIMWVHLVLAVLSLVAGVDALMAALNWSLPVPLPRYVGLLAVSLSMLLRSVSEFAETERELIELRNE